MRKTPLTAMLTLLAALAATFALAGCGEKSSYLVEQVLTAHPDDHDPQALNEAGLLTGLTRTPTGARPRS